MRPPPGSLRAIGAYRTKRELVYGALRDAIQAGRLRAGERLVIHAIASELGVSDVPVREALFQLEAEGLIDNQPHVGATVAGLDPDEVRDVYLASSIVEGATAALAVPHMTSRDQRHLQATLEHMDAAIEVNDVEELARLDQDFHRTLYARCPSAQLLELVEQLWGTKERVRTTYPTRARGRASQREHRAIVSAVQRADSTGVEALIRDHLRRAGAARSATLASPEH
ncbi:MAG: GntR family transcriptional regulator [Chloroflexi bacterium]|nr:GntR family transcriptional regulator [Chloroflexota bacterium]MCY3956936.1 GntR family transcriptional regulator [Chloroflexota bacterium]